MYIHIYIYNFYIRICVYIYTHAFWVCVCVYIYIYTIYTCICGRGEGGLGGGIKRR